MANTIQYGRRSIGFIPDGSTDFDLATIQTPMLQLGTLVKVTAWFVPGETVTQATSGATGVVETFDSYSGNLWLSAMTGTFDTTHVVTGGTGGSHGIPMAVDYAFPKGLRLSKVRFTPSAPSDRLIVRGKGLATGPELFNLLAPTTADVDRSVGGRSLREKLYVLASEQTFGTAASAVIVFEYD